MNWADFVIIGVLAVSTLVSLMRGFVKEAVSLATWVAAIWLAILFTDPLADRLAAWIDVPSVRAIGAFALIALLVLILGGLLNFLIGQLVEKTGISGTDRLLGLVFGLGRGVILVALLVLVAGATPFPEDPWWHHSVLMPYFERLAVWSMHYLPADLAQHIHYN